MELGEIGNRNGFGFLLLWTLVALGEAAWLIWWRKEAYPWADSGASLAVGVLRRVVELGLAGIGAALVFWAFQFRLWTIPHDTLWGMTLVFLIVEFFYYWHHRWAHEIRWLWATHGVHHTAPYMNFSTGMRLGATSLLSGTIVVFLPIVLLGVHPVAMFVGLALSLLYQIPIHSHTIPKLGFLEGILNTPSAHRVHHASNPQYLDRNYGGVLIIFDRLFGTYAEEQDNDPVRYGLVVPMDSRNPIKIAFFEWVQMARDVVSAKQFSHVFFFLFGPPGWSPDGTRKTSAMVREEASQTY